MVELKRN